MSGAAALKAIIEALLQPSAYPMPVKKIDIIQTHISVLFLTEERVYKVKKPVDFGFVDYSTLEQRRHFCHEEVRLNRRLTDGVYLDIVPITRDASGRIQVNGDCEIIEYAVEMVRLPARRMMSALLDRGEVDNEQIDAIVDVLVEFHRKCPTGDGVDEFATASEITQQCHDTLKQLKQFATEGDKDAVRTQPIPIVLHDHVHEQLDGWLRDNADLLSQRVREGRIREGHGDLHSGNICLTDRGIQMYDCIEFTRHFRCRDVACEIAFLAMDLDLRCFRGFGAYLVRRYARATDDGAFAFVADFYKQYLATVRSMVALMKSVDGNLDDDQREQSRCEGLRYLHLAATYSMQPAMVLMCGLPATGKSTVARAIARPFEAVVLRSDAIRKQLAGLKPHERSASDHDEGIYTPEFTNRTYEAMRNKARDHLADGRTVIVDATFSLAAQRKLFLDLASEIDVAYLVVETTCAEETVRERMKHRVHDRDEISEADWSVYQQAKTTFEPPKEIPVDRHIQAACEAVVEDTVTSVLARLLPQGSNRS